MRIIRIDERLIHGQVIIGWIENTSIRTLTLIHDSMNTQYLNLYRNMIDPAIEFLTVDISSGHYQFTRSEDALFIVEDIETLYDNCSIIDMIKPDLVNIGGIRHDEYDIDVLDFVKLTNEEAGKLLELHEQYSDVKFNARELPDSKEHNIIKLVQKHLQ
ncbi:MAG: PTS sugar transporter subunit IIB [bacterium]